MLNRNQLAELAAEGGETRVSLYVPTHRSGARAQEGAIHLKNLLTEAEALAASRGQRAADVRAMLAPLRARVDDVDYWNHQSDGLALFVDANGVREHRLAASPDRLAYVGDRFCIRPLLAAVSAGNRFHVLALSQNRVRLLECTEDSVRELHSEGIPESLEAVVGHDYEEHSLQFHSASRSAGGQAAAMYHGHGRASDKDKSEIERFARAVDEGVLGVLRDRNAPLVLATVGYVAALYRGVSKHPRLQEEILEGNPELSSDRDLQRAALELLGPRFDAARREAVATIGAAAGSDRVVTLVGDVLELLAQGRIGRLLVRRNGPLWGTVGGGGAEAHEARRDGDDDLLDLAVHRALATGAEVHSVDAADVPDEAPLAALLRY